MRRDAERLMVTADELENAASFIESALGQPGDGMEGQVDMLSSSSEAQPDPTTPPEDYRTLVKRIGLSVKQEMTIRDIYLRAKESGEPVGEWSAFLHQVYNLRKTLSPAKGKISPASDHMNSRPRETTPGPEMQNESSPP